MIRIFTGDDRIKAGEEIRKVLGAGYEVIDSAELTPNDLPQIFLGANIFSDKRKIVLRDFTANSAVYPELHKYLNTPHEVILFESKLDKRTTAYKEIKDKIEVREFKTPEKAELKMVFDIYKVAKRDGKRAVTMLRGIEQNEEPVMFAGLLISQALKDFATHPGVLEKRTLKKLSQLDMKMKSSGVDPWLLVEAFLLDMK